MREKHGEVAAIVTTKITVIAVEGLGHDPLRAVDGMRSGRYLTVTCSQSRETADSGGTVRLEGGRWRPSPL
jgi:hypothetical protein